MNNRRFCRSFSAMRRMATIVILTLLLPKVCHGALQKANTPSSLDATYSSNENNGEYKTEVDNTPSAHEPEASNENDANQKEEQCEENGKAIEIINTNQEDGSIFFRGEEFRQAMETNDETILKKYIFWPPDVSLQTKSNVFQAEDCFLSHRGPDTKLDLVVPISRMMTNLYGHSYFVDCEPTNMLAKAQAESTTHVIAQSIWACEVIVVFLSPNFHESEWCLWELYTALYRRQTDPSLKAVHIIYCDGIFNEIENMAEYAGLGLGDMWGTEFKEGTALNEFASSHLHKLLYQLIHGSMENIESDAVALSEWRKVCRHRFGIPPTLKYFMGREDELSEISKILQQYSSAAITTSGVGGVGKSQLVVSWIHQNLSRYSLVVWIRAEQDVILKQDLAMFGEQELGLQFTDKEDLEQRASRAMQAIKNRSTSSSPAMIIFDNAESYSGLLDQDWIPPPGSYCHSIVTTRDSASCSSEEQVKVGPLDEVASLGLVEYFLDRKLDDDREKPQVLEMLESFDFLPLAIVSFAVFTSKFGLDDAITRIQEILSRPIYDKRNYQGKQRSSVHAVLLAQIEALNEGARTMLEFLSVLAAENVPTNFLKSLFEKEGKGKYYHEALEQLMDRAIVLSGGSAGMVSTHRLFQSTTMHMSSAHAKLQNQLASVAECLTSKMNDGHDQQGYHDRQYMSVYLPHAHVLVQHHWPSKTEALGALLHVYGTTLKNEAQYSKAVELYEQALVITGSALGKDHPSYVATLVNMANGHNKQGHYAEAMELYKQASAITSSALGKDHLFYADTLHYMANVHNKQGHYAEAMELYKQALAIKGRALGEEDHSYAVTLHDMASVHDEQGEYREAMERYKLALTIKGSAVGKDHPNYAATLHAMAGVHDKQGRYTQAMELYQQALAITGRAWGKDHPDYAASLLNIASVHDKQGRYSEAMERYKQALAIHSSALGKDHPSYVANLVIMGNGHNKQGRYAEAMELYEQALGITGSALGKDHPDYAATLHAMANIHNEQSQHTQAMELYEQALVITDSALGKDHPSYATILHAMGIVHDKQGQSSKAMELYEQALAIRGNALDKDHPDYAAALDSMATVHDKQGRYSKAMALYEQALTIRGSALGKDHPSYATTLHSIASVHDKQGRYAMAMELYENALAITSSALGKDHPSYATILHAMASVHDNQGRYAMAMELYEQALAIRGSAFGKDHPDYATTLHNMASVHDKQGLYMEAMELYEQALGITGSAFGKDHPDYAAMLQSMALVYDKQGQYTEAMELYEQALAIQDSTLGKDHPSCATTLHNMAGVHDKQGRYTKAMELYKQALAIKGSAFGKDHPDYAAILTTIAGVHDKQGRYAMAMELYEQALAIQGIALGKDHPSYAATLHGMASVHEKQGRYTDAVELYQQALAIVGSTLGKDHPDYAATLHNMASLHYKQGDFGQSLTLLQQVLNILMKVHDGNELHPNVVTTRNHLEAVKRKQHLEAAEAGSTYSHYLIALPFICMLVLSYFRWVNDFSRPESRDMRRTLAANAASKRWQDNQRQRQAVMSNRKALNRGLQDNDK